MCVAFDPKSKRLTLTGSCDEKFVLTYEKNLQHIHSGKCVVPESLRNGSFITLVADCSSSNSRFMQTDKYSVKHIATGQCIHPSGGLLSPVPGTKIVIYSGCGDEKSQFKFIYGKLKF